MSGTSATLGVFDGVSARAHLSSDALRIESFDGAHVTVIPLLDILRVVLEWPWGSGAVFRNGYIQFVTREDKVVGGSLALHHGQPNIVEIDKDQLQGAINFAHRVESVLPQPDASYTPTNKSTASAPPQTPAQRPDEVRTALKPASEVRYRASGNYPAASTSSATPNPALERLGTLSNQHLGTIAAGVALLASFTVWSFWFAFWVGFLSTAFPPDRDTYGFVYQSDYFSFGRVLIAAIAGIATTYGSWRIARSVVGAD